MNRSILTPARYLVDMSTYKDTSTDTVNDDDAAEARGTAENEGQNGDRKSLVICASKVGDFNNRNFRFEL